jgi:hypothetical protein
LVKWSETPVVKQAGKELEIRVAMGLEIRVAMGLERLVEIELERLVETELERLAETEPGRLVATEPERLVETEPERLVETELERLAETELGRLLHPQGSSRHLVLVRSLCWTVQFLRGLKVLRHHMSRKWRHRPRNPSFLRFQNLPLGPRHGIDIRLALQPESQYEYIS